MSSTLETFLSLSASDNSTTVFSNMVNGLLSVLAGDCDLF